MGQYYYVCIKNAKGNVKKFESDSGLKLMEFSWANEPISLTVSSELEKEPHRVFVIGDYAEASLQKNSDFPEIGEFLEDTNLMKEDPLTVNYFDYTGKYIVNYTKGLYYSVNEEDPFKLFLLCSIGNGQGGGDYFGINKELCGTWCGDMIGIVDAKTFNTTGFTEYGVCFNE